MLDADKLSEDDQLGAVTLALGEVREGGAQEAWHELDRAGARLRLRTRWLSARPAPVLRCVVVRVAWPPLGLTIVIARTLTWARAVGTH